MGTSSERRRGDRVTFERGFAAHIVERVEMANHIALRIGNLYSLNRAEKLSQEAGHIASGFTPGIIVMVDASPGHTVLALG